MARHKITASEEKQVRTLLNLASSTSFPRCVGRDPNKVKELEAAGDYSHSGRGHVCESCQCEAVAGEGTRGDLYGIGLNIGHYGAGLCATCEKASRAETAERIWKEHFRLMTTTGLVVSTEQFENKTVVEANQAVSNMEVKDAILRVRESIAEFERLKNGAGLTEKGKDGPQEMSDATRLTLMMRQATVLNELGKTAFEFNKELHIPMDTMRLWVVEILNLLQQITMTKQDYDKAVKRFKEIMARTRTPTMMMAEHEVAVDRMPREVVHDV